MTRPRSAPLAGLAHARLSGSALRQWAEALATVRQLEADGFAAVLLPAAPGGFEPLTLAAGLVPHTRRIGLVAGIDPVETPPFTAARRLAALDHASQGRIGWLLPPDLDAARAADYADAVAALWDSWDDGLHRVDRVAGRYVETSGIRAAGHHGPFYRTAGPLDVARPPQGHPVRYAAAPGPRVDVLLGAEAGPHPATGAIRVAVSAAAPAAQPAVAPVSHPAALPVSDGDGAAATLRQRLGLPRPARSRGAAARAAP